MKQVKYVKVKKMCIRKYNVYKKWSDMPDTVLLCVQK